MQNSSIYLKQSAAHRKEALGLRTLSRLSPLSLSSPLKIWGNTLLTFKRFGGSAQVAPQKFSVFPSSLHFRAGTPVGARSLGTKLLVDLVNSI